MPSADRWMTCSACRADLAFGATHFVCSVSTCNRARTRLVFCSVPCWDSHVATLRHRDAWAVEAQAPSRATWEAQRHEAQQREASGDSASAAPEPARSERVAIDRRGPTAAPRSSAAADDSDLLIVVSRLKKYVRERSGMNTSDAVAGALSEHVRALCDQAIRSAAADGRKTVLDRDVPAVRWSQG